MSAHPPPGLRVPSCLLSTGFPTTQLPSGSRATSKVGPKPCVYLTNLRFDVRRRVCAQHVGRLSGATTRGYVGQLQFSPSCNSTISSRCRRQGGG